MKFQSKSLYWITDNHELRQAMLERDEAYQAWLDLHTPESREDYCRLRNSVKAQLAQARREFLGRQLLASDRKEFWSSLRRFYLAPSASAHSTSDKSAAEQRARADRFNEFFASTRQSNQFPQRQSNQFLGMRSPALYGVPSTGMTETTSKTNRRKLRVTQRLGRGERGPRGPEYTVTGFRRRPQRLAGAPRAVLRPAAAATG
ncbi:hypothetical protein FJT64_010273 [Amphibalanus amphitrite]|uniref:Uncharacterized protein n=1 Tax=Amphibalanus amphitrite TaxID=1232801 RepID=A0A6A4VES9_AMPAM|nr:hypothetical protein FJT64_010273 [Amphibalanus amphitrite]